MNTLDFPFAGRTLTALPSGALWDRAAGWLCVSDLHLGKSDRVARRLGLMLPPYEVAETLDRLAADLAATDARTLICLGDSFDDLAAAEALDETDRLRLLGLQAGRRWIWIEGNHDPGPSGLSGEHRAELSVDGLTFRHIATPAAGPEVSGHYHPKHRVGPESRPAFLFDADRLILPAYGTYTGGLRATCAELSALFPGPSFAILTGPRPVLVPVTAGTARRQHPPRVRPLRRAG
ncbi:ligase-associated DNA damage response endonuclease PdeM [Wenxinia marina]|uniref:Putative phosphoesterase n=1 Tax=Wenxinia marina DSM 24838 TaxID=1123501 RepID=A0A0D0NJ93_9RHOB|nr:ligase-associated DNA damage response endonuclease PdeM [Wenxinia marina]KIQ68415.1 putative phosphoesterase [Wenxinia marina DSM 24838]GGL72404.1 metallophosphoesterase [Wenxinia marina]